MSRRYNPARIRRFWRRVEREDLPMVCTYCGITVLRNAPDSDPSKATVDHIIPRSKGGTNQFENLVIACWPCNLKKGDRSYFDRE